MCVTPSRRRAGATSRPRCLRRGVVRTSPDPPARASRSTIEPEMPAAVVGDRGRIEAPAAVAHEDRDPLRLDLEVHRDGRRARVTDRVDDRLARREQERLQARGRAVAHAHDLDRHAVLGLDLGRELVERGAERAVDRVGRRRRGRAASVRSSRSCMRASRTTSRGSSARRCTSASVCSTESCRCAATSARSSERMRSRRSPTSWFTSSHTPGPMIEREADEHDGGADHAALQRAATSRRSRRTRRARPRCTRHRRRSARARRAASRTAPRPRRPRRAGADRGTASRAAPGASSRRRGRQHRQPDHRRAQRPHDHVARPRPDRAHEQQHARARPRRTRPSRSRRSRRNGGASRSTAGSSSQPARVEQRAEPAGERQHEHTAAHDVRVDADRVAEPGGDARDDAPVVPPHEPVPFEAHPAMIALPARPADRDQPAPAGVALRGRLGDLPDGGRSRAGARSIHEHALHPEPDRRHRHRHRTEPAAPKAPWRFVRRERGRMIAGVATGMADAFHIDVVVDARDLGRRRGRLVRRRRRRLRDLLARVPERRAPGAARRDLARPRRLPRRNAGFIVGVALLGIGARSSCSDRWSSPFRHGRQRRVGDAC